MKTKSNTTTTTASLYYEYKFVKDNLILKNTKQNWNCNCAACGKDIAFGQLWREAPFKGSTRYMHAGCAEKFL